jgi:hypothetical protein
LAAQLIDVREPDGTETQIGVTHYFKLSLLAASECLPGETVNVKSVNRLMTTPSIVIVAPGGVEVTVSFAGSCGLCDDNVAGKSNKEQSVIATVGRCC